MKLGCPLCVQLLIEILDGGSSMIDIFNENGVETGLMEGAAGMIVFITI